MRCITIGVLTAAIFGTSPSLEGTERNTSATDLAEQRTHATPEKGGPRRLRVTGSGQIELLGSPHDDAPVLRTLDIGAVLQNLGCEQREQRFWCRVRPLQGRSPGFVKARHLEPAPGPDGTIPKGLDDSPIRARNGDFQQTGRIRCAQIEGEPLGECSFGVARGDGGDATVVVTFSNSFKRTLFFANGLFISGDATMSGTGHDTDWRVVEDRHFIRVDDQRYELSDAAIFGN